MLPFYATKILHSFLNSRISTISFIHTRKKSNTLKFRYFQIVTDKSTRIFHPFLNSIISANHDKVEGYLAKYESVYKGDWNYIVRSIYQEHKFLYIPQKNQALQN